MYKIEKTLARKLRWALILPIVVIIALISTLGIVTAREPNRVSIESDGMLSLETHAVIAAQTSDSTIEPIPPTYSVGGLPIKSVQYNSNDIDGEYILKVEFNGINSIRITQENIEDCTSKEAVENEINNIISERLGKRGYGAVHVHSLEPLRFTTQFSKNKIEGEWWK